MVIAKRCYSGSAGYVVVACSSALLIGATACNGVTGANRITLVDDLGEDDAAMDDGGMGGAINVSGNGVGGATGNGTSGAQGSGTSSAAVGAGGNTTAGATASASSAVASSSAGPTNCQYPSGPYGLGYGDIVSPSLSWQGYAPGASQSQSATFTMEQFHDCDGTLGINALAIETSQFG